MIAGNPLVKLRLELEDKLKTGLDKANKVLNKGVTEMQGKLNNLKENHIKAFQAMSDEIPGFSSAVGLLTNPYALATAAVVGIGAAFVNAKGQADEWNNGMAKINVTAGLAKTELKDLSSRIMEIGADSTTPLQQVPDAFNRIISSGLDVNTSLKTLEPTLRGAKVGFMDAETAASAAVNVMNSSGIMDATRVWDIMTATTKAGNAEFKDIANYLPKIIPGARAAGHSLEEVGGAFAFLTGQGQSAEASTTGLMNLFKSLSDGKLVGKMKELGVNVFDSNGAALPMIEVIDQLKKKTDSLTAEGKTNFFEQIGFDMETSTAIGSMMQNMEKLKTNLDDVTNSAGSLDKAFTDAATAGDIWAQIKNMVTKTMIEIGDEVSINWGQVGNELLPMFETGLNTFKDIMGGIWDIVVQIGRGLYAFYKPIWGVVSGVIEWVKHSEILSDLFNLMLWALGKIGDLMGVIGSGIEWIWENTIKPIVDAFDAIYSGAKELMGFETAASKQAATAPGGTAPYEAQALDMFGQPKAPVNQFANGNNPYGFQQTNLYGTPAPKLTNFTPPKKEKKEGDGTKVGGKAEQVRNITIHINTLGVNGDFVSNSQDFSSMNKQQLQAWFNEMLQRFAQNLETSYG